jgi:hypothetical protein
MSKTEHQDIPETSYDATRRNRVPQTGRPRKAYCY